MRLVLQRGSRASVRVAGRTVAEIGPGLLILVGVGREEAPAEADWLASKVFHLRIFEDDQGKMNRSVAEMAGEVLVVPQFTLYGDARKGRRPSWVAAAPPDEAARRVEEFADALEALGALVARGAFQEHMEVDLVNDGPVTLLIDGSRDAAKGDHSQ
jgi:D-tyrosyl-tRNA(Tyr) deacylase